MAFSAIAGGLRSPVLRLTTSNGCLPEGHYLPYGKCFGPYFG
jgi:hypothetical protein